MTDNFDEDYVLELFTVAQREARYLEAIAKFLKYEMLPTPEHRELWKAIQTNYRLSKEKLPPSLGILRVHFRKDIKVLNLLNSMRELGKPDVDQVLSTFNEFIKQHTFVAIYDQVYSAYNSGNKDEAYAAFKKGAIDFSNIAVKNIQFEQVFGGFEERTFERQVEKSKGQRERLPTPIEEINFHTHGGGEAGEAWLYLGQSGDGKSFLLTQHGVQISRRGGKVAHFQAEGTRRQCLDRYDSSWTGATYYNIKDIDITPEKLDHYYEVAESIKETKGEIFVEVFERFGSKTMADIRQAVIDLKKEHPDLQVIIIDYLELIDPAGGKKYGTDVAGEKARQQELGRQMKDLAVEQEVWLITATQASSVDPADLDNPNFVMTRFNIGADKDKTRPFDVFVTINRTRDERRKKICRLHIDKAREHIAGQIIYIKQNLRASRFCDAKNTRLSFFTEEYQQELEAERRER